MPQQSVYTHKPCLSQLGGTKRAEQSVPDDHDQHFLLRLLCIPDLQSHSNNNNNNNNDDDDDDDNDNKVAFQLMMS